MSRMSLIAAMAAVVVLACAPPQPAKPDMSIVRQEVAAFLDDYLSAISSRDAEKLRSAYVPDDRFVWIEDGTVRYQRVEDVLASLASFPSDSPIRTEIAELNVVSVGLDAAHAWASFKTTIGEGPRGFSFEGVMSFALESDGDAWKIVGGHTSTSPRP